MSSEQVTKPNLYQFLVTFQLKGAKDIGENWRSISVKASRKRKFIKDEEIRGELLDQIIEECEGRKFRPFSALSCLEIRQRSDGSIGYYLNVPEQKITDTYLDILDAIIKGYRAIKKREDKGR